MILFFETYSVIQILFLFKYIRKTKQIYFHKRNFPGDLEIKPKIKQWVTRLVLLINNRIEIRSLPDEIVNRNNFISNKMAIDIVNADTNFQKSKTYQTIVRIIRDENVAKCYKAQMVDDVSARLLYGMLAASLKTEMGEQAEIILIPSSNDNLQTEKRLSGRSLLVPHILDRVKRANSLRALSLKIWYFFLFTFLPTLYLMRKIHKIRIKVRKVTADIANPVIWGIDGQVVKEGGANRCHNDAYLYNNEIKHGKIMHIFGPWRFSRNGENREKQLLTKLNIPYVDIKKYKINPRFIGRAFIIQWELIKRGLLSVCFLDDNVQHIHYSLRVLLWLLDKMVEFENVDFKVEFRRDDYSPAHVVGTILCQQNGKKSIGIQHNSSPYSLPRLAFVHMDKYLVMGDKYVKLFSPFWGELNLEKTGRENIDWIMDIINDTNRVISIKEKIQRNYRKSRFYVVITCPEMGHSKLKSQWDEMFEALWDLKAVVIDFTLFLRLKTPKQLKLDTNLVRFLELPKRDERIIVKSDILSTQELIAVSDLFIGGDASFAVMEALATKAKIFSFTYRHISRYWFSEYGKGLILTNKEDILGVFRGLENDFEQFDIDWARMKRDLSYHYDGQNRHRIREVLLKSVSEVEALRREQDCFTQQADKVGQNCDM